MQKLDFYHKSIHTIIFISFLLFTSFLYPNNAISDNTKRDIETAFGLYSDGIWNETIRFLKPIINKISNQKTKETAIYVLADSYRLTKDYNNAIIWYKKYLKEFKEKKYYAEALYHCASIYYAQHKLNDAEATVTLLLKFINTHPNKNISKNKIRTFLGYILFKQGKYQKVVDILTKHLEDKKAFNLVFQSLIQLKKYKNAVLLYNKFTSKQKKPINETPDLLVLYADACFLSGSFKQAEATYTKARNLYPKKGYRYFYITYKIAQTAEKLGHKNEAISLYKEIISNSKDSTLKKLGRLRLKIISE